MEENDDRVGEEFAPDEDADTFIEAAKAFDAEILESLLCELTENERWLILHRFVLPDEPISEHELSRQSGIPQKTLNNWKKSAIKKLKIAMAQIQ